MRIIYVPLSNLARLSDLTATGNRAYGTLAKAENNCEDNDQIVVMASYETEDNERGIREHRMILGIVGEMWIPGPPEEDGEWLVKLKEGTVMTFEMSRGDWVDDFGNPMEIHMDIVGYRPLIPLIPCS